jgi:tetratricopeptide (TPR) repeat protein
MNPLSTAEFFIRIRQNDKAKIVLDLLKPYANSMEEIDQLGKLYAEIREFNDTYELAQKIYEMAKTKETKFDARVNIIRACLNLNDPYQALTYIDINEKEKPDDHPNLMDKAMAYFLLDRKDEGETILRKILTENPTEDTDIRINFNLGTYDLRNGKFKEGLRHVLLDGRKLNIWESINLPKSQLWEGGEIEPGKIMYVCSEGGIGDEIISVRFLKQLKELGVKPIWYTNRKDIASIFERAGFETVDSLRNFKRNYLWTYSMPVPSYLELEEDELWYGTYLTPLNVSPKLTSNKKKIGIKSMGNPKYDQDLHRTIPFEQLIESIPEEYEIYSFHVDEDFSHPRVIPLKDKIKTWDDTLDYLNQMDLVISSCTSLIHASGAIGKESIVIVPILTYYTWARPDYHTKWYGENLTILRQIEYDNWNAPLNELKELLKVKSEAN